MALYIVVLSAIAMPSDRMATAVNPRCRPSVRAAIRTVDRSICQGLGNWEKGTGQLQERVWGFGFGEGEDQVSVPVPHTPNP